MFVKKMNTIAKSLLEHVDSSSDLIFILLNQYETCNNDSVLFQIKVTSRKDQQQYWVRSDEPYRYVPVKKFAEAFKSFHVGQAMTNELAIPFDKTKSHPAALTTSTYGVSTKELLKAQIDREILLIKRNSFVYIYLLSQVRHINIHKK